MIFLEVPQTISPYQSCHSADFFHVQQPHQEYMQDVEECHSHHPPLHIGLCTLGDLYPCVCQSCGQICDHVKSSVLWG